VQKKHIEQILESKKKASNNVIIPIFFFELQTLLKLKQSIRHAKAREATGTEQSTEANTAPNNYTKGHL
jgi:predicted metal-dependent phosphoesterase TrpH